jgi:hypothetical protein
MSIRSTNKRPLFSANLEFYRGAAPTGPPISSDRSLHSPGPGGPYPSRCWDRQGHPGKLGHLKTPQTQHRDIHQHPL